MRQSRKWMCMMEVNDARPKGEEIFSVNYKL